MSKSELRFITPDERFGLSIDDCLMERILQLCRNAAASETGGILVGNYTESHDWAIVADVSGPPKDSIQGRTFFNRGVYGIQEWINSIWKTKIHYYLGEWHYHPFTSPEASSIDKKQLKENSENKPLNCPEPVMLIIGGDPNGIWKVSAYIHPKGKKLCTMNRCEPISS